MSSARRTLPTLAPLLFAAFAACEGVKPRPQKDEPKPTGDSSTYGFAVRKGETWDFHSTVSYRCDMAGLNSHSVSTRFEILSVSGTGKSLKARVRIVNVDSMERCVASGEPRAWHVWNDTITAEYADGDSGLVTKWPEMGRLHGDDTQSGREAIAEGAPRLSFLFRKLPSDRLPARCEYAGRPLQCAYGETDSGRDILLAGYGPVDHWRHYPGATNGSFRTRLRARNSAPYDSSALRLIE